GKPRLGRGGRHAAGWRPTAPWPRRSASTVRPATARWPRSTTSPTPITGSKRPWTPVSRRAPPPLIVIMVIWLLGGRTNPKPAASALVERPDRHDHDRGWAAGWAGR